MRIKAVFLFFAGVFGLLSLTLSAMLAHHYIHFISLIELTALETAINFQLYHSIALLVLSAFAVTRPRLAGFVGVAGVLFIIGTLLFSICIELSILTPAASLGHLAPFGGLALMLAWLVLIFAAIDWFFQSRRV